MEPWNIGNNKVLNIKMPFYLHWCQSATFSLIYDFFYFFIFYFYNFLSSVCSIVVLIKFFFFNSTLSLLLLLCSIFGFKPFWCCFAFVECVVHSVMHVQFFVFFGRFCYVFRLKRLWFYALWFANVGFYCIWLIAVANNILHNFSIFRLLHQSWCLSLNWWMAIA